MRRRPCACRSGNLSWSSFDLDRGASSPVVVFPVRQFLHDAQVHADVTEVLDQLAARMTASLACLLQDLRSSCRRPRAMPMPAPRQSAHAASACAASGAVGPTASVSNARGAPPPHPDPSDLLAVNGVAGFYDVEDER